LERMPTDILLSCMLVLSLPASSKLPLLHQLITVGLNNTQYTPHPIHPIPVLHNQSAQVAVGSNSGKDLLTHLVQKIQKKLTVLMDLPSNFLPIGVDIE